MKDFSINKLNEYLEQDKNLTLDYCKQFSYDTHCINIEIKCNGITSFKTFKKIFELLPELPLGWSCLGVCYENGIGTDKDLKKAFEYYKKAYELDNSFALVSLARCYLRGIGTEINKEKAKIFIDNAIKVNPNDSEAKELLDEYNTKYLTGVLHIEHINIGSKSECDAAFLYLENSDVEKVKLKFKDSPLFSIQDFLPYKELFVECKGKTDSITGTFIIDEINRSEI